VLLAVTTVWINHTEGFNCSHIIRERNMVADYMVDIGSTRLVVHFDKYYLLENLMNILHEERLESFSCGHIVSR